MVGRATPHEAEHLDHLSPGFLLYPNQGRNFNLTRLDHLLVNWELTATAAVLRQFSGVARDSILCATMSLTAPIDAAVMACTYTIINHTSMTPLTCRRHQFTKPDLTFVLRGLSASCRRYLWHHKFFSQNVTCQSPQAHHLQKALAHLSHATASTPPRLPFEDFRKGRSFVVAASSSAAMFSLRDVSLLCEE